MPIRKFPLLPLLLVLILSSLACVTVTGAFQATSPDPFQPSASDDFDSPPPQPEEETAVEMEPAHDPEEYEPHQQLDPPEGYDEYDPEERPTLTGPASTLDTAHFRVHYTFEGEDAVPSEDYVREIADTLEHVWDVEINRFGWAAPPPDGQIGGNSLYDVYLKETLWDGTFGYVENSMEPPGATGDNPGTDAVESRAAASFMVLDNDYANMEDMDMEGYSSTDMMRSTAAHEFNHALQFGYDSAEPADWLWEATATWMQDEVYDEVNDGVEDLYSVFKSPDTCQPAVGGTERVEDDGHWYGQWIFLRYISERHGHETVRRIWEHTVDLNGYEAIEAALQSAGASLEETLSGFSTALLLRDFKEGSSFPLLRLEGETSSGQIFTPTDGVGQMAADFVEVLAPGPITITLNASDLKLIAVGLNGSQASTFEANSNWISLDASSYDHVYLIIVNPLQAENEYQCAFSEYTLQVTDGGDPQEADGSVIASNFSPPQVEALMDPDEIWGEGWEDGYSDYEAIQPPDNLIPGYLPEGYELYEAYIMTAADLDEDAIWYTPLGGDLMVVDFYGPGSEDYLSASSSEYPYSSFDQFFDEADWEPVDEEWRTLHGVDVIIEDYGDTSGPYSYATFILGGEFIVVEGSITPGEMERVAASMLE